MRLSKSPGTHILVCVNEREEGHPMPCCKRVGGQEVYDALKNQLRTSTTYVTRTRCLGFCNVNGTTVVIHPMNVWFSEVTLADVPRIVELVRAEVMPPV